MSNDKFLSIQEASDWASQNFDRDISPSNISYLVQYGQVKKYEVDGEIKIDKNDLNEYYSKQKQQEVTLKNELGEDLNWNLSFSKVKERDRTKHVHRLHPYKGKFIPQLVEYFLDDHKNNFKKEVFFNPGDIVLDPFCGSGTTLVQANELGIHAVGIDISEFNSLISNVKIGNHDLINLKREINHITKDLAQFVFEHKWGKFEDELSDILSDMNKKYFPTPDYRYQIRNGQINESDYIKDIELEMKEKYEKLVDKFNLTVVQDTEASDFISKWYLAPVRKEIDFLKAQLLDVEDEETRDILKVILSRTIRSCRATTHADLATLKEPIHSPYYCRKHYKLCKPLFSTYKWWKRYSNDTLRRLSKFNKIRTDTYQVCLIGDSRSINIIDEINLFDPMFAKLIESQKIKGIFSSPPYVGLIDYHEQHAYAYDLFGFTRRDDKEIGPMFKGIGQDAKDAYVKGISRVLTNSQNYLTQDFDIFLVANDKHSLYPIIAKESGLDIVNKYRRPVLNRTEKDKSAFSEIIFHMKRK